MHFLWGELYSLQMYILEPQRGNILDRALGRFVRLNDAIRLTLFFLFFYPSHIHCHIKAKPPASIKGTGIVEN